jgi:hypothetical protein
MQVGETVKVEMVGRITASKLYKDSKGVETLFHEVSYSEGGSLSLCLVDSKYVKEA